jgi:hypothetical protein
VAANLTKRQLDYEWVITAAEAVGTDLPAEHKPRPAHRKPAPGGHPASGRHSAPGRHPASGKHSAPGHHSSGGRNSARKKKK